MANITVKDTVEMQGDILPDADNTRNLGNNSAKWAEVHTEDLYVAASVGTNLLPDQDNVRSLGSPTKRWGNGYIDNLTVGSLTGVSLVPSGMIAIWSGTYAIIPSGWVLCDGQNGTPDLRDRFVVGAGLSYSPGLTGGQNAITQVPAHTHTLSGNTGDAGAHSHTGTADFAGGHVHVYADYGSGNATQSSEVGAPDGSHTFASSTGFINRATSFSGSHSHTITTNVSGSHAHTISGTATSTGSASVDIRPPYYALAYIMKA